MTNKSIMEAQDYLRVKTEYGCKRLLDIHSLLKDRSIREVISFMKEYLREKEKTLRNMILIDKTHPKVDQIVSSMFRITMAIKSLEEGKEVILLERSQQGAEKSCRFYKRDSCGHRGPGIGKDILHDGKNRTSGQAAQCAT